MPAPLLHLAKDNHAYFVKLKHFSNLYIDLWGGISNDFGIYILDKLFSQITLALHSLRWLVCCMTLALSAQPG